MIKQNFILVFLLLLFGVGIQAQTPIQSSIDTTDITIGDQFELTIKALTEKGSSVNFPESERFGSFEIIDSQPLDTLIKNEKYELIKRYSLTQFDSGSFKLPPLPVLIDKKEYLTDEFSISVKDVQADTIKQPIYEIKGISTAGAGMSSTWFYYIAILLSIVLGIILFFFIKRYQERNMPEDELYKTPFDKASTKLKRLIRKKKWVREDVKKYYSDITDIARVFLEDTFNIPARELTTYELLKIFRETLISKKIPLDKKIVQELKNIFQNADLVKFAKSKPQEFEIISDSEKIQEVIAEINTSYPIALETKSERIKLIERNRKRRFKYRTFIPIGVTFMLLTITGIVYFINNTEDGDFLKSLSFNSTKRLLKGEWVTSTYGNPGIKVETPKVLIRYFDPKLQHSLPLGVKNVQQFRSGQMAKGIGAFLNMITFERKNVYDKEDILHHTIQILAQNLNAKNPDYKKEDFENPNGVRGLKAVGTILINNPLTDKEELIKFEIVLLVNDELAQEIGILYPENDPVGPQIAQKMLESIEYITNEKE